MSRIFAGLGFLFWGIRGLGIAILFSYPMLGAAFALPEVNRAALLRFLLFFCFHVPFGAHIYLINDWSDARLNPDEPRLRKYQAMKHPEQWGERGVWTLALVFLAVALVGFAFLSPVLFAAGVIIAVITNLYSHPRTNFKGVPLLSTCIHFCFVILYFTGGWGLFAAPTPQAFALALYFGLVLSAGHYSNEIEDFQSDLRAGIRTNAIAFGQRRVFRVGLFLFLLSSLYLMVLAGVGWIPPAMAGVGGVLTLAWVVQIIRFRRWQGGDPIHAFRHFYRILYAGLSLLLVAWLLWEKG